MKEEILIYTMKGFRTVNLNRQSYDGLFQWGDAGSINIAPDWDPDPEINCGHGLHFVSDEPDQGDYIDITPGRIFQIIEAEDVVKSADGDKYRCRQAAVLEEKEIRAEGLPEWFYLFGGGLLYVTGWCWSGITDEMRREAWPKLKGEWLYYAGRCWQGITDEMRKEAWPKLKGEWLYRAGSGWQGITDEMRKEAWKKLEGEWLFRVGRNWRGITDEMRREAWEKLEGEWLYYAGIDWSGITDEMRREAWPKLKGQLFFFRLYGAGRYWSGITNQMKKEAWKKPQGKRKGGKRHEGLSDG